MSEKIVKTKQVNQIAVGGLLETVLKKQIYNDQMLSAFTVAYRRAFQNLLEEKWIECNVDGKSVVKPVFYNTQSKVLISSALRKETDKNLLGHETILLTDKEVLSVFSSDLPDYLKNALMSLKTFKGGHWIGIKNGSFCMETQQYADWNDTDSINLTIIRADEAEFEELLRKGLISLTKRSILSCFFEYILSRSNDVYDENTLTEILKIFYVDFEEIERETEKIYHEIQTLDKGEEDILIDVLLNCDKRRIDLESYERKILDDINAGHWELWEKESNDKAGSLSFSAMIARNPASDIVEDGLVGIDFGTKSTIVSVQNNASHSTLLRIGVGKLSSAAEKQHYENPTIMEFVDLEQFLSDYEKSKGRPETSIHDVTVSHKANNSLKENTESDHFYSYFYDIKQWCGNTNREIKIIDQKGQERLLPTFVSLKDGDFNPLEIYAYYLGLYINNMRNGIYMEYILSFPVTYTKDVKKKILNSFTAGLKKSLPESILNNSELMKQFRVTQGVSEPAAYAITALSEYGFDPDEEESERVYYGIFDFGGGTTDFDFGVFRCPKDDVREEARYDFIIEQFGSEGDRYLGGENLLELMAFEIFKANAGILQPQNKKNGKDSVGFSFSKPEECEAFPGSETLISNSQEARRNTKQLMEVLRPFWEGIVYAEYSEGESNGAEEIKECIECSDVVEEKESSLISYGGYQFEESEVIKDIVNGSIKVDLLDREGKPQLGQTLYIFSKEENVHVDLLKILEKRIERGVNAFFESCEMAFSHHKENSEGDIPDEINVFLAGNSSKSPILRKCFGKYINCAGTEEGNTNHDRYKLFPALGTEEANRILAQKGLPVNRDITAPTGKTGVAYGLIAGREGGSIKVYAEVEAAQETKFRYNLGKSKRGKFVLFLDRNDVSYGEWHKFIDAGAEFFEVFYTSIPGMSKQPVGNEGILKKRCRIEHVNPDLDVYIRAVSPEEIEYLVAENTPGTDMSGMRIRL